MISVPHRNCWQRIRRFGTCVAHHLLEQQNPAADAYRAFIARHFNTVVGESSMKWAYTEKERGTHDFTWADQPMAFAEENGLTVRVIRSSGPKSATRQIG